MLPTFTRHDGFPLPKDYSAEAFKSGQTLPARASDVFVCAYPDCGTAWVLGLVNSLLRDGEVQPADAVDAASIPHLERHGRDACERMTANDSIRLFRTHLPYNMTPQHPDAKYIVVGRNPKDTSVSFYHRHVQDEATWDNCFERFLEGDVEFGNFFAFFVPWFERHVEDNVLFLTYEYLINEPRDGLLRIARFLGNDLEDRLLDHDSGLLHAILQAVQTEKGRVKIGEWRNVYSPEQSKRMDERFQEMTKGTGAEHMWSDVIAKSPSIARSISLHEPMSMDRVALEEELARQLAEVDAYDDDIEDTTHPELTSTPFHRLDLSALLHDVRCTPLTSQAYQEYAAALVECDATLIASMEATLADVQTCLLPWSCDHPVVVSVERTAMETPEVVSKPAHDTSEATETTFCVDHCPPCCIGPCKTHCPPDCIVFLALSDAKTKADAILAAEEAAFMQLALASVEKIAADVRSQPKRESLNSAAECSAVVPAVDPMATSDPEAEQKARERLEQIERSQQALEAQERALAELVAAEERAQRERELARQAEIVADERRRQDEAQRLAGEARKQREIAQQAIDAMEMAAEERQMRAWLRAKEESNAKDARQAMERAERQRLQVEASMRRQREVEIRRREEEREREELARMETVEREQRAIAAAEKERRLQVEKEKQELERRKLADAKKALEDAQRQERQRQLEQARQREEAERKAREEQQRLEEEEETQRRQERERNAKEQRRLEEEERQRSLEAATRQRQQQHFQAKVLPTMIQRHREKRKQRLALESMAEEEKQSMLVETMLKKEERAFSLAKWLRRWKSMVVSSGRQKVMAASCIQHGWRRRQRQKKHVRAAQAVQRRWRAHKAAKELRRRRQDARTAAHVANRQLAASRQIQRAWRRFDRRRRQQLELEDAAAKVQSAYRGFHIRKKLTTALQLAKFVDGDEFEYDEVNLDEFLGGAPEIDDEDDFEKEDSVDETPILHRHAWFPSTDDDLPPVDHLPAVAIHQTTIQPEAKGSSNQENPEVKTTASTASSLYKRMQRAIAHGRRKQKPTSKPKPDVATTVTWSTSGKKAKKVNVPSLVDRLRRTTASSR
ncbi:hypothetical protein Ae201684_004212 [Aphanomyces euteiches]|uniref:Sulfotransferase domain-containing protein n=1 Tax=Aphanomyces euteiches TaxID=100861 RepID=A0A6G0XJK8_9STRA|nr:hypothetical protein Ae201684_004212 [Aphanomyces euteiches]